MHTRPGAIRCAAAFLLFFWMLLYASSPGLGAKVNQRAKKPARPSATAVSSAPPPVSTPIKLPEAAIGNKTPYDQAISIQMPAGMTSDLTFSIGTVGAPPAWLQIPDANRAEMKGDLTSAAAKASCSSVCHYLFHVVATDGKFHQTDQAYELTVNAASPTPAVAPGADARPSADVTPQTNPNPHAGATLGGDANAKAGGSGDTDTSGTPQAKNPTGGGDNRGSPPAARTAPVVPGNSAAAGAPDIVGTLTLGSSAITVSTTKQDYLSVWSYPSTTQSACDDTGNLVGLKSNGGTVGTIQATDNVQTLSLAQPLAAGTSLCVAQIAPAATSKAQSSSLKIVQDPLNYGRVHMYFVGGVLVSNTQSSFSSSTASQFLAFDLDKTWRLSGCNGLYLRKGTSASAAPAPENPAAAAANDGAPPLTPAAVPGKGGAPPPKPTTPARKKRPVPDSTPECSQPVFSPGISTYFDTQLTAIPVVPQSTTQVTATTTTGSSGAAATPANNAITSQKAARVAVGVYAPFIVQHWGQITPNAFYIAPIAKVGFNTLTGNTTQTNVTSTVASTTAPKGSQPATAVLQTFNRVYNFYSFGGRLGWVTLNNSRDRAPDPVAFFDFDFGPYSSLESFVCHPAGASGSPNYPGSSCGTGRFANLPNASRKRIYRFDIQSLITVPHTPIALGFNANIGQRTIGSNNLDPALAPGDDVRFLFGTKFDISTVLQKLNLPSY